MLRKTEYKVNIQIYISINIGLFKVFSCDLVQYLLIMKDDHDIFSEKRLQNNMT